MGRVCDNIRFIANGKNTKNPTARPPERRDALFEAGKKEQSRLHYHNQSWHKLNALCTEQISTRNIIRKVYNINNIIRHW